MATPLGDAQATRSPSSKAHKGSPPKHGTDDLFHISPFNTHLHDNTISHIYMTGSDRYPSPSEHSFSPDGGAEYDDDFEDSRDAMSDANIQELQEPNTIVPPPNDPAEAYLLLATARADRQVRLTRKNLVLQIIHRNTLTLQYNRLVLEKAQEELRTADSLLGRVRFTIRKSGIPVAFECAMREDPSHSIRLPTSAYNAHGASEPRIPSSTFDVQLD